MSLQSIVHDESRPIPNQFTWTARRPRSALRMYKISKGQLVILGNSRKKILIVKRRREKR